MISVALEDLECFVAQRNYGECANRILALSTLLDYFRDFQPNPVLNEFRGKFAELRSEVQIRVSKEFERTLFKGKIDPSMPPAFRVIDALGEGYSSEIIEKFCLGFLGGYQMQFKKANLEEFGCRINWMKQRIDVFELEFAPFFPQEWRIPYFISRRFCLVTKTEILEMLKRGLPSVEDFQIAFKQAARFERILAKSFGAPEFIGMMSEPLAAPAELDLDGERKCLLRLRACANESSADIDSDNHILKSGIELVQQIKLAITRCGEFSVGFRLYDLFFVIKEAVRNYIVAIESRIPQKIMSEGDIIIGWVIANTTHHVLSVIDGLGRRISELVDEYLRAGVKVDDLQDMLQDALVRQLKKLSTLICDHGAPFCHQVVSGASQTGTRSESITTFYTHIFGLEKEWLCGETFGSLRSFFVADWTQSFFNAAFSGRLHGDGPERLSQATDSIRELFIANLVTSTGNETTTDMQRSVIIREFQRIVNGLKIVISPEDALVKLYLELFTTPSKEQFMLLVRARGIGPSEEERLEAAYISEMRNM